MSHILLLIKRSFFKRKAKSILTIVALALGVSILVSLQISISATKDKFADIVNSEISYADLTIKNVADTYINVDLTQLNDMEGVKEIFPRLSIKALSQKDGNQVYLNILGLDYDKESKTGALEIVDGKSPSDNEILIPEQISSGYGFKLGDTISLQTAHGDFDYKISGIMKAKGLASKRNGNICVTTLQNVWNSFSTDKVTSVNIVLKKGSDVITEKAEFEKILSPGILVELPEGKSSYYLTLLKGFFLGLNFFGLISLLAGCFLVYNTMNTFTTNATKEIAIFKVLGGTRNSIVTWFLMQAFIYSMIGAVLGILIGVASSKLITNLVMMGAVGDTASGDIDLPWNTILTMGLLGILVSMMASLLPAIKAAKVTVIQGLAIKKFKAAYSKKKVCISLVLDVLLFIAAILTRSQFKYAIYVMVFAAVVGVYLLLFLLIRPLTLYLSKLLEALGAFGGYLLKTIILNNIPRTVNTIFIIAICLSMAVSILGLTGGFKKSLDEWVNSMKPGDIMAYSRIGFDENTFNSIKSMEGITYASPNYNDIIFDQKQNLEIKMIGIDSQILASDSFKRYIKEGEATMDTLFHNGNTIIISELLAKSYNVGMNDNYVIITQNGTIEAKIVGIIESFISEEYTAYVSVDNFVSYYPDTPLTVISLTTDNKSSITDEIKYLEREMNNKSIEFTSMADEIEIKKSDINQNLFRMFYVLVVLSLLISALCLINSMIMDMNERSFQLSILKGLGTGKKQMLIQVITQGVTIGIYSAFIGAFLGIGMQYMIVKVTKIIAGWNVLFIVEPLNIILVIICGIGIAAISSFIPGLKSYSIRVVEVLRRGDN